MNKKFRLVIIANTYNFFNVFMLNHIQHLSKNYDLFICCNNPNRLKKLIPKNVSLININYKRGINIYHDIIAFFSTLFFFFKKKPDLTISFTPKIGFIVAISSFLTRIPNRIHWYTGQVWANKKGFSKKFFRFTDKVIFLLCHDVLVDGISQRKFLIKEKVISKIKSSVLNQGSVGGVNIKKFKFNKKKRDKIRKDFLISKSTFVFLYLGRITQDKGITDLIEAFKKVKSVHNSMLIFVGSIEDTYIAELIKNNKNILYFNYSNKPEEWFSVADVLCLPSYREGFGNVVIEAASCGLPTLCSNIYGLKDAVIENKTGFFHKSGSINDIKKKMIYIIENKNLLREYGFRAKKRVFKNFEQSRITKKFLEYIYFKLKKNVS